MNTNNECHQRKTTRTFLYIQKVKNTGKRFYIQKAGHFSKSKTIAVTVLYTKCKNTLCYAIFHENFEFGIYCMDEVSDHKVRIYCNLISTLDQS